MHSFRYFSIILISCFVLNSCVTANQSYSKKPERKYKTTKKLKPKPKDGMNVATSERNEYALPPSSEVSSTELLNFIVRHSDPSIPLTKEDDVLVSKMDLKNNVDPETVLAKEAVIVIAAAKRITSPSINESSIQEEDLIATEELDQNKNVISFEENCKNLNIDLPTVLKDNPFLQSYSINNIVLSAVQYSTNSPEFIRSVRDIVLKKSILWADLPQNDRGAAIDTINDDNSVPAGVINTDVLSESNYYESNNQHSPDPALLEAQTLADNNSYKQAIAKAAQVQENSSSYEEAQQKIALFSNMAVQDLRRKAAEAFQNSLPINDPKIKLVYLEEAKKYLESALEEFPKAPDEQLATVKQNLAIISRDLSKVKGEGSDSSEDDDSEEY